MDSADHQSCKAVQPTASTLGVGKSMQGAFLAGWRNVFIAALGTAAAFWFGFWYAHQFPLTMNFHQELMGSALNYACTGTFGHALQGPQWSAADEAASREVVNFLYVRQLDYSCAAFPHVAMTGIFGGADYSNEEAPIYLSLLYGQIWRVFGVHWAATYYVIGLTAALSFIAIYFCIRPFAPDLLAAGAALAFLCNPLVLAQILNPRDCMKMPFFIAVAAVLIGAGTIPRSPHRFILFACAVGALIGVGLGFRPDVLCMLPPSTVIIAFLGQLSFTRAQQYSWLTNVSVRLLGVCSLVASFVIAGFFPLWNDFEARPQDHDLPFHIMAMGLLGTHNYSLYQSNVPNGELYMYRNDYTSDVPIFVRVPEYAARQYGVDAYWGKERADYFLYSKRYYLDVVRLIPADLIARGIGAFVSLMTVPASLKYRVPEPNAYRADQPWTVAYDFARNTYFGSLILRSLDDLYQELGDLPVALWFYVNLTILFIFLDLVGAKFGIRGAFAAIIFLGTVLLVTSLNFELRHMFYLYAFPLVAWTSVIWSGVRIIRGAVAKKGSALKIWRTAIGGFWTAAPLAAFVAMAMIIVGAATFLALEGARIYQADVLHPLITDIVSRQRIPADYDVTELSSEVAQGRPIQSGMSRINILSPMPLSTGGTRTSSDPATPHGNMGLVAVEFDGRACYGRVVTARGFADSDPPADVLGTVAYMLVETFQVLINERTDYVAFLPAFYYHSEIQTSFKGIELFTRDLPCVKSVKFVTEFKKTDVIFDFFVPEDSSYLRRTDLFQRVYIPGLGFV
jgi:hypothetical protein